MRIYPPDAEAIMKRIRNNPYRPMTAKQIRRWTAVSKSDTSYILHVLVSAGALVEEPDGRKTVYRQSGKSWFLEIDHGQIWHS